MRGVVYNVVRNRGFAFLRDDRGKEYMLHSSEIADFPVLQNADIVEFTPKETPKGLRAVNATFVERPSCAS